jgi:hypothetical protein
MANRVLRVAREKQNRELVGRRFKSSLPYYFLRIFLFLGRGIFGDMFGGSCVGYGWFCFLIFLEGMLVSLNNSVDILYFLFLGCGGCGLS